MDAFTLDKIEFGSIRRILAGFCRCSLGKRLAERIGPSRRPDVIAQWLDETTQMVSAVRDTGLPPFGGVTDIREPLGRATPGGGATGDDFAQIASTLDGAAAVRHYLAGQPAERNRLTDLAEQIGIFATQVRAIRDIVGPDGVVLDSASPRLGELRRAIEAASAELRDVIYGYLRQPEVAKLLQNPTVTLHGDRYVLPVRAENRGRLPGVVHRASNTGATVFVEPNASVELNNKLADLIDDERREVQRLLDELAIQIAPHAERIGSALRTLAQVDLLAAKAQYAYQFDMTCPAVTERGTLQLHQARHPLLVDQAWRDEQAGKPPEKRQAVVPIDVRLGADFDLLVVTGSNTGGKTVTLKTVALLAVMAQSGMHIPAARGATLPLFRDVYLDIGDEQSLQQSLSTFGEHIKRLRHVLSKADAACLVLLDELGAGTDPDEGGAIGQAVLDELRRIGCLGMVTTHLSVLKAYAYTHPRVDNASVEFDTKTLSPTYHLHIGTPGESHAITVAKRLGMPRAVTSAAKRYLGEQGQQFRRAIQSTTQARQAAEAARGEAQVAQLAARTQQDAYEAKLADLHRLQEEFDTWLVTLGELQPGDELHVPSLGKPGRLVRLELHKQVAVVDSGSMQVEVPLRELMPDLGQSGVREQIAALRKQILDQAAASSSAAAEAQRIQAEYHKSLQLHQQRARQFDAWLGAIARVTIGDEVPIAVKPGRGKVVSVDLPGLRATVQTADGEKTLSLQDLFPQTGPFARHRPHEPHGRGHGKPHAARGKGGASHGRDKRTKKDAPPKPVQHRRPDSKAARANRDVLLATEPGRQVYVVPFGKRATLIRVNPDKDNATVQSGAFEMEIPLADLEPLGGK